MILELARIHIPDTKFSATTRELMQSLKKRFKWDNDTLIKAIHDKYKELKTALARDKIEG